MGGFRATEERAKVGGNSHFMMGVLGQLDLNTHSRSHCMIKQIEQERVRQQWLQILMGRDLLIFPRHKAGLVLRQVD
ncbi:hypothetical protein EDD11_002829 [Mortierella claussenii]|nr:hypothetical protein EDD11_002829 [Mortierella claussenii]